MSKKTWLLLRGELDKNNKQCAKDGSDVWIQIVEELAKQFNCDYKVWYKGQKLKGNYDYIFARGGFGYYTPILKRYPNAYKIYYGAGARIVPEDSSIKYDLILCDTEKQIQKVLKKFPNSNPKLWIKPAAKHFKPIECEKEYDVCYVADCHSKFQEEIKRVKWVYKNVPRDLKVLHLGKSSLRPPPNVTVKRVPKIDIPQWYSKCKVGIVPYKGYDSMPRVIPEMMACDLSVVIRDSVNYWVKKYGMEKIPKNLFWQSIELYERLYGNISSYYQTHLSLKPAATYLKGIMDE